MRGLLGLVGTVAFGVGLALAATEIRLLAIGSPPIPTLLAAAVCSIVAAGGFTLLRGAIRGRIAVRRPQWTRADG
jgi:hypothetical protein